MKSTSMAYSVRQYATSIRRCATLAALAVLVVGLAAAGPASALTVRVHADSAAALVPDYVATILEANGLVSAGDSIEVSVGGDQLGGSPYVHTSVMTLVDGVVYRGGFGPAFEGPNPDLFETVIELQPLPGEFHSVIDAGAADASTVFAGFTVTGGNSSFSAGGVFCGSGSALTIRDCHFVRNTAAVIGGGITIGAGSSALVFDCDFEECSAGERGGGIGVAASTSGARVEFCRFTACSAATRIPTPTTGGGGGIYTVTGLVFARNTFQSCWSGTDGGAILARNADGMQCDSGWMFDNVAARDGGAIFQDGGDASYFGLQIERCNAGDSSAAGGRGGAVYFRAGTSTVTRSFIRDCSAGIAGGGFYYWENSGSLVTQTEFVNNHASTGGGIQVRGLAFPRGSSYSVEILANTFARNGAWLNSEAGGGIHFEATDFLDLVQGNIIAHQTDGAAISCFSATNQPNLRYNLVYNNFLENPDSDYGGDCLDRTGVNGNIRGVPVFCDLNATPPQLGLSAFSPALGAGEGGEDLGAHQGSDCDVIIRVEPTTWSRIKSYYR